MPVRGGFSGVDVKDGLSTIPDANWIWAPGITADTANADLQGYYFLKEFPLHRAPQSGNISISADDFSQVFVNGTLVGSIGSISDVASAIMAHSGLTTFDITSNLRRGKNIIVVYAQNGPPDFAGCVESCSYQMNPAGVVFGGLIVTGDRERHHRHERHKK